MTFVVYEDYSNEKLYFDTLEEALKEVSKQKKEFIDLEIEPIYEIYLYCEIGTYIPSSEKSFKNFKKSVKKFKKMLEVAKLSNEVAKLAVDLGSFNNAPTARVMQDIQSALVGNKGKNE